MVPILLVISVIFIYSPLNAHNVPIAFRPVAMPNGSALCATATPTLSVSAADFVGIPPGVPNEVQCGLYCSRFTKCNGFNYVSNRTNAGLCQFYTSQPTQCSASQNTCFYYQVSVVNSITQ